MKLTRQLASEITRRGAEMHDALGEEQELRDARLRAINRNMDVQDIEQQVHEQIVAVRENVENVERALANLDKDENSLEGKIEKRRAELERAEKRLSTLESVRPAYMDEYERLQEGLQDLYVAYLERHRNLAHLESELDAHRAEEDERSRERDAAMQKMQRRLREEELKVLRGEERVDEAEEFDEEEFDAKHSPGRPRESRARRGAREPRGSGSGSGEASWAVRESRRRWWGVSWGGTKPTISAMGVRTTASGTRTEGPPPTITTFDTGALARSARRFYTHDAWRVSRGTIRRGSLGDGVIPGRAGMGSEPPDARGAGDSSYPPRGYRSKACLGATFHSQFLNENGVPPVCVGVGYRKTSAAPRTEPAAPHGAYKFTCVGYAQRELNVPGEDVAAAARRRQLPYCEGLQILVADKNGVNVDDPRRRLAFERDVLESVKRGRSREFAEQNPEVMAKLEEKIREKELEIRRVDARLAVETAERAEEAARIGRANARSGDARPSPRPRETNDPNDPNRNFEPRADDDGVTGWILPSAALEAKFVKSAGKIWRNMKRHAAYVADAVASGAGGLAGGGGGGGGAPPR